MRPCPYEPCPVANRNADCVTESAHGFVSQLYRAFRPITLSFCAAGIFPNYCGWKLSGTWIFKTAYSVFVICLLVLTTGRWIVSAVYEHNVNFGIDLFMKMLMINWGLECTVRYIGCAVYFTCPRRLSEFFMEWIKLRSPNTWDIRCINKKSWQYAFVIFGVTTVNTVFITYCNIWSPRAAILLSKVPTSTPYAHILIALAIITGAYMSFVWVAPSLLLHLIGQFIAHEFVENIDDLKAIDQIDVISFADTIKYVRIRHQNITKLVGCADRLFSLHIAFSFMGSVVAVCLMLYNIIWAPSQYKDRLIYVWWFPC